MKIALNRQINSIKKIISYFTPQIISQTHLITSIWTKIQNYTDIAHWENHPKRNETQLIQSSVPFHPYVRLLNIDTNTL